MSDFSCGETKVRNDPSGVPREIRIAKAAGPSSSSCVTIVRENGSNSFAYWRFHTITLERKVFHTFKIR